MARRNAREQSGGRGSSSRAKKGGAASKGAGSGKAAGSRKTTGAARKAAGAHKTAGARKTGSRKAAGGERKPGTSRKNAGGKSEAREMARTRAGGAARRESGRKRSASTRRAAGRAGAARKTARKTTARGRSTTARRGQSKGQYSPSTQRALWIESSDQHAERPGQTLATRDHDVIRQWAEERGAVPATISGTEHDGRPGVLRFDFPNFGRSGGRLRQVDWDEWFETFDARNLVFLFQEQMKRGNQSNFFRLDSPDREDA
jgi:hypothetical protein